MEGGQAQAESFGEKRIGCMVGVDADCLVVALIVGVTDGAPPLSAVP